MGYERRKRSDLASCLYEAYVVRPSRLELYLIVCVDRGGPPSAQHLRKPAHWPMKLNPADWWLFLLT